MSVRVHGSPFSLFLVSVFIWMLSAALLGQASAESPDLSAVDAYVEDRMGDARIPGLALSIVHGNRVIYSRGFGRAGPDGTAVTPETPFVIGSVTKSFTALAIMQLVERGKIRLDDPVQDHLSWFSLRDAESAAQITVRSLLHQTSGFSALDGRRWAEACPDETLEERARWSTGLELNRPVGETFEYSNINYNLLGAIVEAVSGEAYETYVRRRIFEPLDMVGSFASEGEARAGGLAIGHRLWFRFPVVADHLQHLRGYLPSAYLVSSARDLAHYAIAQLNKGVYGKSAVLSPEGIRQLHQPAAESKDPPAFYAMGWFVSELNGVPTVWHWGDVPTHRAMVILAPGKDWAVVLLMNVSTAITAKDFDTIAPGVLSLLDGRDPPPVGPNLMYLGVLCFAAVVLALQIFGMVRSASQLLRWRSDPGGRSLRTGRVVVRLAVDLGLVALVLAIPHLLQVPLRTLLLFQPDVTILYLLVLAIALIWGPIRTGWALILLRSARA